MSIFSLAGTSVSGLHWGKHYLENVATVPCSTLEQLCRQFLSNVFFWCRPLSCLSDARTPLSIISRMSLLWIFHILLTHHLWICLFWFWAITKLPLTVVFRLLVGTGLHSLGKMRVILLSCAKSTCLTPEKMPRAAPPPTIRNVWKFPLLHIL